MAEFTFTCTAKPHPKGRTCADCPLQREDGRWCYGFSKNLYGAKWYGPDNNRKWREPSRCEQCCAAQRAFVLRGKVSDAIDKNDLFNAKRLLTLLKKYSGDLDPDVVFYGTLIERMKQKS